MNVVKLKALDEGAVQGCRAHGIESLIPAYNRAIARPFHFKSSVRCCAAPWQLCTYQSARYAIEDEMLCICSHLLWHVVKFNGGHKVADSASWSTWCAGWGLIASIKHGEDLWQYVREEKALDENTLDASQRALETGLYRSFRV